MKVEKISITLVIFFLLIGCSKNDSEKIMESKNIEKEITQKEPEKIAPEDDSNLKGTPVLGFKMGISTFESVKKRLDNYQLINGESYAGGPILENDGSGFNIEGLQFTQFGFDSNNKLVYVGMTLTESEHMSHETYKRILGYINKNNYKVVLKKAPFVGDQETEFVTPDNETITVKAPHLGGFKVHVEYMTSQFIQQRSQINEGNQKEKQKNESANF